MGILSEKSDINSLKEWVCLWRFEKTQKTRDNRKKKKKEKNNKKKIETHFFIGPN